MNAAEKPGISPQLDLDVMRSNASDAVSLLKGLANESRLMILCVLSEGELSVGQLNQRIKLSQSALSQHLAVLRDKGLVSSRRDGQWAYYSLTSPKIIQAVDLLRQVMHEQLDPVDP